MKLILVDGSYLLHRVQHTELAHVDNGLIHGFLQSLIGLIRREQNYNVAVLWDRGYSKFRVEIDPSYKQWLRRSYEEPNIRDLRDAYRTSRYQLHEFLNTIGVLSLIEEGYEADDFIACCKKYFYNEYDSILIVSGDRDLLQLVDDKTSVYLPREKELVTKQSFITKYKLPENEAYKECYVWMKAMCGDKSDGIEGIKGLGEVKAKQIFVEYLEHNTLDFFKESVLQYHIKFVDNMFTFLNNLKLVDLDYFIKHNYHLLEPLIEKGITYVRKNQFEAMEWLQRRDLQKVLSQFLVLNTISPIKMRGDLE